MPELPEVETVRRGLEPLLVGSTLAAGDSHPSAKFTPATEAVGRAIEGIGRRGKYLLLGLDDGRRLVIHLGMTGQLRVDAPGSAADPYDRAWWTLDDGRRFAFRDVRRFGRLAVVGDDVSALPTLAALGPDVVVESPAELRDAVLARLTRLAAMGTGHGDRLESGTGS